jgi:hypothetical protein
MNGYPAAAAAGSRSLAKRITVTVELLAEGSSCAMSTWWWLALAQ